MNFRKNSSTTSLLILFIVLSVVSSMAGFQFVRLAAANPILEGPIVHVLSPTENRIYTVKSVFLNFTVTEPDSWNGLNIEITRIIYRLDPQPEPEHVTEADFLAYVASLINVPLAPGSEKTKSYSVALTELPDGTHTIYVEAEARYYDPPEWDSYFYGYSTVDFTINTNKNTTAHAVTPQNISPDGQGFPLASPISIISPSNSTYSSNLLTLSITAKILFDPGGATISYSIDGKNNATLPIVATLVPIIGTVTYPNGTTTTAPSIFSPYTITGSVVLPELPEGPHKITVYAKYQVSNAIGLDNCTVFFTINDGTPPIIANLSFENKTYSQNNLPLNFTTDEPTSWMGYSLDGQANVTITGNTTMIGLSNGLHSLTVYANDTAGNTGNSETIYFSIRTEPFPFWILGAVVAFSAAIAVVVALLLWRRRKTPQQRDKPQQPQTPSVS